MPKYSSAVLAVVLATSAATIDAFGVLSPRHSASSFVPKSAVFAAPQKASMSMLVQTSGGLEELQDFTDNSPMVAKQVNKAPALWKLVGLAAIPASAALGFGIVPSRRLAAHALGAAATTVVGLVGKSKITDVVESAATPAIAQVILDHGLSDLKKTKRAIKAVQSVYNVDNDDFESMCTEIYSKYLIGMVKYNFQTKTAELKELEQLKEVLMLNNMAVGEAHAMAASEWYRQTCLFTAEEDLDDPDHPDRVAMDKLLFLTERALRQGGETDEAFLFEMTRTAKAVNLDYTDALDRVAEVSEPFYARALKSTRSKLGTNQVSIAMLARARQNLGVSDDTAYDMHVAALNEEVRTLLGKSEEEGSKEKVALASMKFPDGAQERLTQLQTLLSLRDDDLEYEIVNEGSAPFQITALEVMSQVIDKTMTPDEAWEAMEARRKELLMPDKHTKQLISSLVMQALGGPLEETNKFASVNNEASTYESLLQVLEAKAAIVSILQKSGWNEADKFDVSFCNPYDEGSVNGFLTNEERQKMYRIFMNRSKNKGEDKKISDEQYEKMMEVKGLLGITNESADTEARQTFGPELMKALQNAADEILTDYTPELLENLEKDVHEVIENFHLTDDLVRQAGRGMYTKAVGKINAMSPSGIPSAEQMQALEGLQRLFKMDKKDTYGIHMDTFGSVYRKSVMEAMSITGVIRPEFRAPLNDLRGRLGVSEVSAKSIFLDAVKERMVPMVEWIVSEMERTIFTQQQLSQRRNKDLGEDLFQSGKGADGTLGLGAEINIMSDIMNLIDFYTENDIGEKIEIATKSVEKTVPSEEEGGEPQTASVEIPVYETTYPITALGVGAVDQEMAEVLYRQFIVGAFQEQGPNAARYEAAKATFGGILGLTSEKMEDVGKNIGKTVYDNYISQTMRQKGSLDQQDMMFLANLQGKLGLSPEQGEKLLLDAQNKVLSEEVDAIMDSPTPEGIKYFREKCNSMGLDMYNDVGISKSRLRKMFEIEVLPGLQNGDISTESGEILTEIQESLGFQPDEAEEIFESLLLRLAKSSAEAIVANLKRGRTDNCVEPILDLVRYGTFLNGELGIDFIPEATANQVINVFESMDFSGEEEETVAAKKEMLKTVLSLS